MNMNWEFPDVQARFQRNRGTRDWIINVHQIIEKARESQKNISFCFLEAKAFDCVDHNKLWKILKEMGVSGHITYLLRNLYGGQEEIEQVMEQPTILKLWRSTTRLYIVTLFI